MKAVEVNITYWSKFVVFQICMAFITLLTTAPAKAHLLNESYVYFTVTEEALSGRIEVNTRDLARVFDKDEVDPAPWSEEEVTQRASEVIDYLDGRLLLRSGEQTYDISYGEIKFLGKDMFDGTTFAQVTFSVPGLTRTPDAIEMSFDFIFSDIDPTHRGFALIDSNTRTGLKNNESYVSLVFGPGDSFKTLYLRGEPVWDTMTGFTVLGVWHTWLGLDHGLFLAALLLTAVMVIVAGRWEPAQSLGGALIGALAAVTVFTLANAAGMGLAAFDILNLNRMLTDAAIALCIAFIALGNLFPRLHVNAWKVIILLGLSHGLGSAYYMAPLGLDSASLAAALLGFAVGVELGQIAVVIVLFPVLYVIRETVIYRPIFLYFGSAALTGLTAFWFAERTFNILGPVTPMIRSLIPGA